MNERGFTLLEALISMAIIGMVLASLIPVFSIYVNTNTRMEQRTGAAAAAQRIMENLRRQDPATLPDSGSSPMAVIEVGDRDYEVVTHYCREATYCAGDSRHVVVEVSYGGRTIYTVESVYTSLR